MLLKTFDKIDKFVFRLPRITMFLGFRISKLVDPNAPNALSVNIWREYYWQLAYRRPLGYILHTSFVWFEYFISGTAYKINAFSKFLFPRNKITHRCLNPKIGVSSIRNSVDDIILGLFLDRMEILNITEQNLEGLDPSVRAAYEEMVSLYKFFVPLEKELSKWEITLDEPELAKKMIRVNALAREYL